MKNIFTSKNVRIMIIALVIASVALSGYYCFNEYTYQKIADCVAEGNYSLAENYIETISPNYRDLRKIKNLISIISNTEIGTVNDKERAFSRLESLKGFEDEDVNQVYNTFLFSLYKEISINASVESNNGSTPLPIANHTEAYSVTASEATSEYQTEFITEPSTEEVSKVTETIILTAAQTTTYTQTTTEQYVSSTTIAYTTTQPTTKETTSPAYSSGIVYYVESGEVYHLTADCRTLARSSNILSGPIPEGRRACKVCG